jgi:hypothetical protein
MELSNAELDKYGCAKKEYLRESRVLGQAFDA